MASRLSKVYDINMPADRSEYSYPITNITYHLPESPHPEKGEAAAQKAFQRILDSYDENERLADAFQVELDKRTQIANERKAEERRIRVERQRLAREEKRNKKLGKNHKAHTDDGDNYTSTGWSTNNSSNEPSVRASISAGIPAAAWAVCCCGIFARGSRAQAVDRPCDCCKQKQRAVSAKLCRQSPQLQQRYEHDNSDKCSRGHRTKWGADGGFEIEFFGIRSSSPSPFPASF
ncbi:hypothetical protein BGZ88_006221 [Linnemannia elongata]|nr:hypothetical protein BGZ88_006221 [Linnemannia elongata]